MLIIIAPPNRHRQRCSDNGGNLVESATFLNASKKRKIIASIDNQSACLGALWLRDAVDTFRWRARAEGSQIGCFSNACRLVVGLIAALVVIISQRCFFLFLLLLLMLLSWLYYIFNGTFLCGCAFLWAHSSCFLHNYCFCWHCCVNKNLICLQDYKFCSIFVFLLLPAGGNILASFYIYIHTQVVAVFRLVQLADSLFAIIKSQTNMPNKYKNKSSAACTRTTMCVCV